MGQALLLKGSSGRKRFEYSYTGQFTDETVDGVRTISFLSSGTLTVLYGEFEGNAYLLAGGGGGAQSAGTTKASGGGGGYQTKYVTLAVGEYQIIVGAGGEAFNHFGNVGEASDGGDTSAFGIYCSGGKAATITSTDQIGGKGGTPNGGDGQGILSNSIFALAGGTPNGGEVTGTSSSDVAAHPGGNGIVTLTWEV